MKVSILFVLLLLSCSPNSSYHTEKSSYLNDQLALLTFKAHISDDPHGIVTRSWTTNTSICNWHGVTCSPVIGTISWTTNTSICNSNRYGVTCSPVASRKQQRVLGLSLGEMGVVGTIPPHIGNLSFLQVLNLGGNNFQGPLPVEFRYLSHLKVLNLTRNEFTGEVPSSIGLLQSLGYLSLRSNNLTGIIPSALFNLSSVKKIILDFNNLVGNLPSNICDQIPMVEVISLAYNQISGHIPSNLTSCQNLNLLYLDYNAFTGAIPDEIGFLSSLQFLNLGFNSLQGTIPASLSNLTSIEDIVLEHNNISGSIPRDTSRWSSLESFAAATNQLSGIIWNSYCNLTKLKSFALDNNLHGSIPECFGNLHNLRILDIGTNMLTGTIPSSFSNLSKLETLYLELNQLSGQIPHNIGTSYPNLHSLYLSNNNFTGTIPSSLSYATSLTQIVISQNQLTGIIPPTLGNLLYLQLLDLMNNNLTVEISDSEPNIFDTLSNCRMLEKLWLGSNPFNLREFPSSIGNLSSTVLVIDMSNCGIQGHIPAEIGKLTSLTYLNLSHNDFSGSTLPASLGNLTNLQELYLESSGLEGPIPEDLCPATSIGNLHLHLNELSGAIPSCFGNMMTLREIRLDSNKLSSSIPEALGNLKDLVMLNIAFNDLTGSLPIEIGNMKMAVYINLANNHLSGTIPSTINGLQEITELYLSNNTFGGSIPEEVGKLTSIQSLDLSQNQFSGTIPKGLQALSNLKYFNVSFNRLEGEIPTTGAFANLTAQFFLGNPALCGPPRLNVRPCPEQQQSKARKVKAILKIVLPVVASALIVSLVVLFFATKKRKEHGNDNKENSPASQAMRRVSYFELLAGTNQFSESNLLGAGAFGSVYKATLSGDEVVAVKVFHPEMQQVFRSFEAECEVIKNMKHKNLVKVISSCSNLEFKALVLEYMPLGSLEQWLHTEGYNLNLMQRLDIVIGVSSAIEYLHHGFPTPVVHRDLKPSNVLLSGELVAHVSDFGLAKLLDEDQSGIVTKHMATIGYMAPEYGSGGLVSIKSDVYSFGVILMETFTGMKPTDQMFEGDMSLKRWVIKSMSGEMRNIVDPKLLHEEEYTDAKEICVRSVMELALNCTEELPKVRMSMTEVVAGLTKILKVYSLDKKQVRCRGIPNEV